MRETRKLRRYSEEKPENFIERSPKNFRAPSAPSLFILFLAPPLQIAPLQPRAGSTPVSHQMFTCSLFGASCRFSNIHSFSLVVFCTAEEFHSVHDIPRFAVYFRVHLTGFAGTFSTRIINNNVFVIVVVVAIVAKTGTNSCVCVLTTF